MNGVSLMNQYQFVQNQTCEYFPCHGGVNRQDFNCLFCYCPLYALGGRCGGSFIYLPNGIKDWSGCVKPHIRGNYDRIMEKMSLVLELAKRKADSPKKP